MSGVGTNAFVVVTAAAVRIKKRLIESLIFVCLDKVKVIGMPFLMLSIWTMENGKWKWKLNFGFLETCACALRSAQEHHARQHPAPRTSLSLERERVNREIHQHTILQEAVWSAAPAYVNFRVLEVLGLSCIIITYLVPFEKIIICCVI